MDIYMISLGCAYLGVGLLSHGADACVSLGTVDAGGWGPFVAAAVLWVEVCPAALLASCPSRGNGIPASSHDRETYRQALSTPGGERSRLQWRAAALGDTVRWFYSLHAHQQCMKCAMY